MATWGFSSAHLQSWKIKQKLWFFFTFLIRQKPNTTTIMLTTLPVNHFIIENGGKTIKQLNKGIKNQANVMMT